MTPVQRQAAERLRNAAMMGLVHVSVERADLRVAPAVEVRGVVETVFNGEVMYEYNGGRSWGWLPTWPGAHVGQPVTVTQGKPREG